MSSRSYTIFLVVWIIIGVVPTAFFYGNKNAALKRKIYSVLVIGASALFGFFASSRLDFSRSFSWFFMIMLGAITVMNLRGIKFCLACGATNRSQNPFSPVAYCSKCGTKFDKP